MDSERTPDNGSGASFPTRKHSPKAMKANAIPFTIEQYNALVLTGKATVENGIEQSVQIIYTNRKAQKYPIIGLVGEKEDTCYYTKSGQVSEGNNNKFHDLLIIPNPPKVLGYLNAYDNGLSSIYKTLDDANDGADRLPRIGIVTITEDMIQPV